MSISTAFRLRINRRRPTHKCVVPKGVPDPLTPPPPTSTRNPRLCNPCQRPPPPIAPKVKELPDINTALDTHRGKRFDFCVSIISAEGIPEGYTKRVFCRYVFAQKEEKPMQTEDQSDTRVPKWDYRKRFAWSKFDDELGHYLCGEVLTFEVIGFPQ